MIEVDNKDIVEAIFLSDKETHATNDEDDHDNYDSEESDDGSVMN